MKHTNIHNLPKYVYDWAVFDEYDYAENTFSATELLKPPRQYALYKQNKDKLEIDIADLISARYGTAIHSSFEKIKFENSIQEIRYEAEIVVDGKPYYITGKPDLLYRENDKDMFQLVDIKSCSAYNYIFGSKNEEWSKQLSIYKWILEKNGIKLKDKVEVCMVFTDWSKQKAQTSQEYPNSRIVCIDLEPLSMDETEKLIKDRIRLLINSLNELPQCNDEELWRSKSKWAVILTKNTRATVVSENKEVIEKFVSDRCLEEQEYVIEERKGEPKRCNYCMAAHICEQYKKMVNK